MVYIMLTVFLEGAAGQVSGSRNLGSGAFLARGGQ